ncbi:MAG: acetyltransferase [Eudoraea sp.]|nr:acetyltransferase [Eudoraea sp.]
MLANKDLFIFGYSGHAYVVLDVSISLGYTPLGYFNPDKVSSDPYKLEFRGFERDVDVRNIVDNASVFPAVGSNLIRKKIMTDPNFTGLNYPILASPTAVISKFSQIAEGTLVAPSAIVQSKAQIGRGSIINTAAVVEHECLLYDFVHIAPGAVIAGNVKVKEGAFIGANATVKEGITIGRGAIIGAGAVIIRDVPAMETWVGNPGKRIRP